MMKKANPCFVPIPASITKKRPLGNWAGSSYMFERDFSKREQWEADCNLGLVVTDEYLVIDVDNKPPAAVSGKKNKYSEKTGMVDFLTLIEQNEPLPETVSVTTPSGGKHYYFKLNGREEEANLKNWTSCMSIEGALIAVDIRKKGGYVMCPPSKKNFARYNWDSADGYKKPMALLPNWILSNIVKTYKDKDNKIHFEKQFFTTSPVENGDVSNEDVDLFKKSKWWQPCFEISAVADRNSLHVITAAAPYQCSLCKRLHSKNSNHPFLVRNKGILRFVCRPGKGNNVVIEQDTSKTWNDIQGSSVKPLIETLDITNRAVSKRLFEELGDKVYPTGKPKMWLAFEQETGIYREEFRDVIMRPFLDQYVKDSKNLSITLSKIVAEKASDSLPESKKANEIWTKRLSAAEDLIYSLSMFRKKNDHLDSLFELVRDSRKEQLFNSKKHLLHFAEGSVYDFRVGQERLAQSGDKSTMSSHQVYLEYNKHPEEKKQMLKEFFNDLMLGRQDLTAFLLRVLSSVLSGETSDQLFYFFSGKGSNGKSTLVKLMRKALGDYGAAIASAQVSKPNLNAQGATPSLMALLFKRAAFLTEMEEKVLHTEFLKMIAGGDTTSGRGLFEAQRDIELWVKIFIAVNDLPSIIDKTHGFWRKVVVIPFDAHFTQTPDPTNPTQKKTKPGYEMKLMECADTLLAWLVDIYNKQYLEVGVQRDAQPELVLNRTKLYQESQNIPLQFYRETVESTDNKKDILRTSQLDQALGNFCKDRSYSKTPQLVKHVYEFMDEQFPPTNATRQLWRDGKNVKAWEGCQLVDQNNLQSVQSEAPSDDVREAVRSRWG